jgi:peptidoglycan/xylan/chitin deacetylase (PgdA/CDA1 family)
MVCTVKRAVLLILLIAAVAIPAFADAGLGAGRHRNVPRSVTVAAPSPSPSPALGRAAPVPPADIVAPAPYAIMSAALTQQGQQIAWQIEIAHAFTAVQLAHDGRALCLALDHFRTRAPIGELCVKPRRGRIALVFTPAAGGSGAGLARTITAKITRSSASELTATFLPSAVGLGYTAVRWQVLSELVNDACGQPSSGACPPLVTSLAGVTKLHVPALVGCVASGASLVFHGSTSAREIALTFDDGPWPTPPASTFIALLARYHVPATFFEIGRQIPMFDASGATQRAMLANGDMIGDHTWSHPVMTALAPAAQEAQIEQTAMAIRHGTGFTPCLWRPPYGAVNAGLVALARSLGFLTIMWNVDPRDWATPGVGAIYANVIANARNGAIVIHHFGGGPRYQTIATLPHEITALRKRGYTFVTVTQMLGLRLVYR